MNTATLFVVMCTGCRYYNEHRAIKGLDACICSDDANKFYQKDKDRYVLVGCTDSYKSNED